MSIPVLSPATFKVTHTGGSRTYDLIAQLAALGWWWEIAYRPETDIFAIGLAYGPKESENGSIFGGAKTVEGAFDKLAQWTAEKICPRLASLSHAAERHLDAIGLADDSEAMSLRALRQAVDRLR